MDALEQHIARALDAQEKLSLRRHAPIIDEQKGLHYRVNGKAALSFCSNDFLGFGSEYSAYPSERSGSGASRLVHGSHNQIRDLETEFAEHLGYEDAILFPSGYQANIAGLAQLPLPPETLVFSDALNHASIIDGLKLRATNKELLPHLKSPPPGKNWWIVESRYSMDGDAPRAQQLQQHLEQGGYLYLDEAHRFGLEPGGHGLAQQLGASPTKNGNSLRAYPHQNGNSLRAYPHRAYPHLANYPLGKAFGMQGAILAGNSTNIAWIKQFSRAYTYTTAPSPTHCRALHKRLRQLTGPEGDARRSQLNQNIELARKLFDVPFEGPILSVNLRENQIALRASQVLLAKGYHVQAIRPPTVPEGSARLRITLSAVHTPEQISALHRALTQTIKEIQA